MLPFWSESLLSSHLLSKILKIEVEKTMILIVLLCGCESWSLTPKEEHRMRVFEIRVLRRIFGPNSVLGACRRLHSEELHNLHASPNIKVTKSIMWRS
jgi:hypothetical protein